MGKASIIAILAFGIVGMYYSASSQQNILDTDGRVADHQIETLAANAAHVGLNRAKQMLADDFASHSFTGEFDGLPYEVEVSRDMSKATINVTVRAKDVDGKEKDVRVQEIYKQELMRPLEVPSYQEYAVISNESLTLGGALEIGIHAKGSAPNELNANMHSNEVLTVNGNAAHIEGFGTYVNNAKGKLEAFEPQFNPNDHEPVQQVGDVAIPEFDISDMADRMQQYYGNFDTIDGEYRLNGSRFEYGGTYEEPAIRYVTGDLVLSGNTTVVGYTMFVVEGDVRITSGGWELRSESNSGDGSDESSIAIYGGGNMDFKGSSELWSQLYIKGDLNSSQNGAPTIYGNVTALGEVDLAGNPEIYYRKASPALIADPMDTQIELITHNEWVEPIEP